MVIVIRSVIALVLSPTIGLDLSSTLVLRIIPDITVEFTPIICANVGFEMSLSYFDIRLSIIIMIFAHHAGFDLLMHWTNCHSTHGVGMDL